MQLEYICDMELVYREEPLYSAKFLLVRPYAGEEGTGYGEGDGSVTGPQIQGSLRWVNHPHRRSDGAMLPDADGVILTEDHALQIAVEILQARFFADGDRARRNLRHARDDLLHIGFADGCRLLVVGCRSA